MCHQNLFYTVGFNKNCTLVFRDLLSLKSTPNLQSLLDFESSYGTSKKSFFLIPFCKSSIKIILRNFYFL